MKQAIYEILAMYPEVNIDKLERYMRSDGATPKQSISDKLSKYSPKDVCVLVMRATLPSKPSRTIAIKMYTEACIKLPSIATTIE